MNDIVIQMTYYQTKVISVMQAHFFVFDTQAQKGNVYDIQNLNHAQITLWFVYCLLIILEGGITLQQFQSQRSTYLMEQVYTQRVYIDPERLMRLKKQRKSLKLVPSIFQPPSQLTKDDTTTTNNNEPSISFTMKSRSKALLQPNHNITADIVLKSKSPNVEFIIALLGEVKMEQVNQMEEGDCLNIRLDERWLILEGEVRVTGHNNHAYNMQEGYFFFVSAQTKKKVKEVVCLRRSKVLRISSHTYESFLKNYLFLKNAQKIKYLKYCPFFLWSDQLSEDLASCMTFCTFERQETVYSSASPADFIFFVKEGVVLLQRSGETLNPIVRQYESHYEKEETNEKEATMIVKKGMVFGVDGILIKEYAPNHNENPQNGNISNSPSRKKINTRIYTAKTIGRTQLYCIKREILQTLFNESDLQSTNNFPKQMTKADLQRICADYADLVVRHRSLPKITQAVIRKDLVLHQRQPSASLAQKKVNAQRIRFHEQAVKKLSIANIIADRKTGKKERQEGYADNNASLLNQLNYKLSLNQAINQQGQPFAFPSLSSSIRKRRPNISQHEQNMEKYIFKWLKDSDPQREYPNNKSREMGKSGKDKSREKEKRGEMLINVRSYRNIIPLIG